MVVGVVKMWNKRGSGGRGEVVERGESGGGWV